jgi:hypothetical protein
VQTCHGEWCASAAEQCAKADKRARRLGGGSRRGSAFALGLRAPASLKARLQLSAVFGRLGESGERPIAGGLRRAYREPRLAGGPR